MNGWLIYSEKDIEKNQFFINSLCSEFQKYNFLLKPIIYENTDHNSILQNNVPDFAINRSRFFDISEILEANSVRVFNNAFVTKLTNNKLATYQYLKETIPMMPTIPGDKYTFGAFNYPIVLKNISGHGGNEVFLAQNFKEELYAKKMLNGKKYLVQQCCDTPGKDLRIYILGNKILSAVLRTSDNHFKSNYSLGGHATLYSLSNEEMRLVDSILCKLNLDYAGIDLIFHNNRLILNEIEDAVGARMLYEVSDIDIVSEYAHYIIKEMCLR